MSIHTQGKSRSDLGGVLVVNGPGARRGGVLREPRGGVADGGRAEGERGGLPPRHRAGPRLPQGAPPSGQGAVRDERGGLVALIY